MQLIKDFWSVKFLLILKILRNIACFNYSVNTHKLESARGLWFKLYGQRWRTSQDYLHWKSSNISETVLDRHVTTGH